MLVEILVLGGQGSLPDIAGERGKQDGSAPFVGVDFINQLALPIQKFGGNRSRMGSEICGVREVPEKINVSNDEQQQ